MGVKKKAVEHGDRVRWGDRMGTIIDTHEKKSNKVVGPTFSVLPDVGPHTSTPWPKTQCVVLDDVPRACPRCGVAGHRAQSCQAEYLAWRATTSNQLAQQPSPQPVAPTLATDWDVDF